MSPPKLARDSFFCKGLYIPLFIELVIALILPLLFKELGLFGLTKLVVVLFHLVCIGAGLSFYR